jgi:predicted Rossmann fold nucleotide-binding protein DprA/Smf involved in DNA uptake
MKTRNPFAVAARQRRAGPMRDRRAPRGGAHNEQRELLEEVAAESGGEPAGRIVAITGNRLLLPRDREVIAEVMRELAADPGVGALLFGGAIGADTAALEAALDARRGDRPRLVVVVPDTIAVQPRETQEVSRRADERVELGLRIRPEDRFRAYRERNRRLVERATELIAFWNGQERSGTAATIRLARARGIPVRVVTIEGGD